MMRRLMARLERLEATRAPSSPRRTVLLVPGVLPPAEWEAAAIAQQEDLARHVRALTETYFPAAHAAKAIPRSPHTGAALAARSNRLSPQPSTRWAPCWPVHAAAPSACRPS